MSKKELIRCSWPGLDDAEYARYHDEEWGVPNADSHQLFEKLILEKQINAERNKDYPETNSRQGNSG